MLIRYCDGDDFWLDPKKLQKQMDVLDRNPDCSFCFHDVMLSDSAGKISSRWSFGRESEHWMDGAKSFPEFVSAKLIVFHATSTIFRREAIDFNFLRSIDPSMRGMDFSLEVMLGSCGRGYYLREAMAAYRKHDSSVSARRQSVSGIRAALKEGSMLEKIINEYYGGRFHEHVARGQSGHTVNCLYALARLATSTYSPAAFWAFLSEGGRQTLQRRISPRDFLYIARTELLKFRH